MPEPTMPLLSQLATAFGVALWPARWTLRVVRGRAKAARQYRLGGIGWMRALWRAVDL